MYGEPWEWLLDVGRWSERVAPSAGIFVLIVALFYIISLFVRHAIETRPNAEPSVALHRGRIATAIIMVLGLLVAGQGSGLFGRADIVPAGIGLIGTLLRVAGTVAAAALIAAGLAAGFGARDVVASALLGVYFRSKWGKQHGLPEAGARVTVGDTEGELTHISPLYAHIRTADGATVFMPTARVVAEGMLQRPEEAEPSGGPTPPEPTPEAPSAAEERKSIFD